MTQPSYVPIVEADQVRPAWRLRTPAPWTAGRVAEITGPVHPTGRERGAPGPDQGYALLLADRHFADRLQLGPGDSAADALMAGALVASSRAAAFGRAPVAADVEHALTLFGFMGGAPDDLVAWRRGLFSGAAHHYEEQRRIVDSVRPETLRLTPAQVAGRLADWRSLVDAGGHD